MEEPDNCDFLPVAAIGPIVPECEQDPSKLGFSDTFKQFAFTSTTTIPACNKCAKSGIVTGRKVIKCVSLDR